ncbi:MAG: DUF5053 domain-containing protein [Proteiniphilum sp.]|jgi:hypothetical protein|uniref:DUF5053 domain-containing protein n=1 Tax=Proteiniphilum sp. TaxID=1926877 RepID=UPI002B1ED372|nr:DUF5053 domain-containing protein [Proteiniphilum sp.]MEA5129418.1 DUF5053 domain-containing protein [Proteiniphilum sp.]
MNNLKKDLAELKKLSGIAFARKAAEMKEIYTSAEEIAEIHRFIASGFDEIESELKQIKEEVLVRDQLAEVAKFVNLSYIAENYFHKSKTWLSQRIHGHVVSGKPRYLSNKDKETLNFALKDMADKLGSLTVS